MPDRFYFAYVASGTAFNAVTHAVEDEEIVALRISQSEGDFASLEIDVRNPGQGLLAPSRQQWCWLSWGSGSPIVPTPLFHGRMVGVAQRIQGNQVRLLFISRPLNFNSTKETLADSLKVLPYWDQVWITGDLDDPDAVLNTYGKVWHIDRITLALTTTDELEGEDGTIIVSESEALYDNIDVSYGQPPISKIKIEGTLTWTQSGSGTIDLTHRIYDVFRSKKSIYLAPYSGVISTLTGDGLMNSWPKTGASLGGGWTVNSGTYAIEADPTIFTPYSYKVNWVGRNPKWEYATFTDRFVEWEVELTVYAIQQETLFDWEADRKRTEKIEFTIASDIQPLLAEPDDEDNIVTITMNAADTVTEPTGSPEVMPIGDVRRRSYLNTDRGFYSVQYLFLLARAELRRRARAVEISARVPWTTALGITLRKNAQITDSRIPGGVAIGKIISYEIVASGSGEMYGEFIIGCSIGRGGSVTPAEGAPTYVDVGYVETGYQISIGAEQTIPTGDVVFQSLDDFEIDDDGVDLLTLDEDTAVESLVLENAIDTQTETITDTSLDVGNPDPLLDFRTHYTQICLQLTVVAGDDFETTFTPTVTPMPIPHTIDLEAA